MTMLVTLEQASDHLRRDTTDDDNDLTLKIHAASGAVLNYLKSGADAFKDTNGDFLTDTSGDIICPFEVKAAVLLLLGIIYKDRDGQFMKDWEHGYLPMPVTSLLYPLRDPALA